MRLLGTGLAVLLTATALMACCPTQTKYYPTPPCEVCNDNL